MNMVRIWEILQGSAIGILNQKSVQTAGTVISVDSNEKRRENGTLRGTSGNKGKGKGGGL